jgi:hypothetical protein
MKNDLNVPTNKTVRKKFSTHYSNARGREGEGLNGISLSMDKLVLTGPNLGRVLN